MAETVNINPDTLIEAAAVVAQHLAAAAVPPAGALPPALAPSPADVAAAGVDHALRARLGAAAAGLDGIAPIVEGLTSDASGGLCSHDAAGADRIAQIDGGGI